MDQKSLKNQKSDEKLDPDPVIEGIKIRFMEADQDLYENLRLFIERMMLYRITRAEVKSTELGLFARLLLEVGTMTENPEVILNEISGVEALAKEELSQSDVTILFSTMVRVTEALDAKQLYYLLDKIRNEPMPG